MRRLIESTFMTIDGDIQEPHEWGAQYWDDEYLAYAGRLLADTDALLLGRVTFEGFAQSWPQRHDDEYADRINALPKYVASTTLTETSDWNGTVIRGDVATAVKELKEQEGTSILKFGTGALDRPLLADKLVDEYHFWVNPVLAGTSGSLVEGIDVTHLTLDRVTTFASGIVVLCYTP